MSSRLLPPLRRAGAALGVLASVLAAGVLAWDAREKPSEPTPPAAKPARLFTKPEPAKNPITLQLQADERQVVGWVSGPRDYSGRPVYVRVGVEKVATLKVGRDNTFTWRYKVEKPTTVEFLVDDCYKECVFPKATAALTPPPAAPGPCVFFVVDRTAYRPGQALHFAGFLRKQPSPGEFAPVADRAVEVVLTSQRKGTKAAKMKLTSDELGRVVGSYVFTDGDALDHYTLSVPGYKGEARVLLGEYRKSKVKLRITGAVEGEKMRLTFEGLDFLDKPVVVTKASFAAQVVRRGKAKNFALKGEDFVYHEPQKWPFGDLDSLSEEDLLYWEAEGVTAQTFLGLGNVPLSNVSGELKPEGAKPATHTIDLNKDWLKGDCAVVVQGVITDANGREQRASATIPIEEKAAGSDKKALEVSLPRRRYFTGEPIEVRATGTTAGSSLVVMKLAFQTPSTPIYGPGMYMTPYPYGRLPAYRSLRYRNPPINPAAGETIRRTLVTAVPFAGDVAKVTLKEPGAYKLVAVAPREEGSLQEEVTVVVRRPDEVNALQLRLDKEEYAAGDRLTGVVHGRFADARALLTVRDSGGIRLTKPITFKDGMCALDVPLPADLRYGCTADVCYPDDADHAHVAQAYFRVVPSDRMLKVQVKTPESVAPGGTVDLDLQVNRKEPVDLVVSVYDQALLGIAADKAVNIRDFFLADERAGGRLDQALLQRRIGGVRVGTLVEKAKKLIRDAEAPGGKKLSPQERASLQNLLTHAQGHWIQAPDIATLLRLAGVEVFATPVRYGSWYKNVLADGSDRLLDVLKTDYSGWMIATHFVGNTLLLHETHSSYIAQGYRWHPVFGWDFGYGNYLGRYNFNNTLYFGDGNQLAWQLQSAGGRGMARGDAARSWNGGFDASGNSMYSFAPEAQGFISHLPAPGAAVLLDADADQSHISVRRDFSDSAFWDARVRTDEQGKAKVSFKLPDSLTNWQVVVTAVSPKMHVGSAKASFRTYKPIMVWPMLPRTFTEGDRVEVFASVHNRTDEPQRIKVRLKVENGSVNSPEEKTIDVPAKENAPVYWTFRPGQAGFTQLLMSADCAAGSDASLKRLPVIRAAAEQIVTASGTVKKTATIEVPEGVDPKASRLEVSFAPSLAADMADTLNYLVEYPYGCVEQTMSRFLPAIKVAQILRRFKVDHPQLEKKLPGCVAGGIKRLLEIQQPDGGWAWHGGGQTHEMMTPYALYGLLQAEKAGYQIPNENAIGRGLARLEQFVNNMGDSHVADRVYCMYVWSHRRDLTAKHWEWLAGHAAKGTLSDYALALALEMAVEKKQPGHAADFAKALRARAKQDGGRVWWETARFSRWGDDRFEVTAAALKALVAFDKDDALIDSILGFFAATKRGDRWNSTKDTAMILFAMADYLARTEYSPQAKKTLSVSVNGGAAQEVRFDDQLAKKVVIPGERLKAGKNTLTFDTAMTGVLYRAVFRYWKSGREIAPMDSGIKVTRTFHLLDDKGKEVRPLKSGDKVPRGSYVLSVVRAEHRLPVNMNYVLVENPKASGGEVVPADDPRFAGQHAHCTPYALREDREAMTVFHHETTPQALADRSVFLAELAGEYVVAPASVEMMYQTETRGHSGTFVLEVTDGK
jgi:hypothetical protein